ncbi:uncharacterized protein LOC126902632 isoform X2 [Daktulosphaira vitifoliae]|uniref:uncharacterized protein LOC126902632 isoform X2 n=1 Tax=Daktulosphaira vitifoliae TaxID=58002 RepID=UPI0021A992B3|nr:uncharacterized protein LOC126902632 isoform X2 [Daktulosphaira vitifoliae]
MNVVLGLLTCIGQILAMPTTHESFNNKNLVHAILRFQESRHPRTDELVKRMSNFLSFFDQNKSGKISLKVFLALARYLGQDTTHLSKSGLSMDSMININTLVEMTTYPMKMVEEKLLESFRQFDTEISGYISLPHMRSSLNSVGIDDKYISIILLKLDFTDEKQKINYSDFLDLLITF